MFRELLEGLLRDTGAEYGCVADAALGKVLEEGGVEDSGERLSLAVLGWSATAVGYLTTVAADDLDDLIVTSRRTHHLVRQVGVGSARPLLVYLRLDRRRGTLAAALRELAALQLDRPRPTPSPRVRSANVTAAQRLSVGVSDVRPTPGGPAPVRPAPVGPGHVEPIAPPVAVPLPRRQPAALPVQRRAPEAAVPAPPAGPVPLGGRWRADVATMQRLLLGLKNLR